MREIFNRIYNQISNQLDTVLITIVAGSGSTPRGAGARMWVSEDGTYGGTIGGGNAEYQAFLYAKDVLKDKKSIIKGFNLSQNDTENINMICGGQIVVCFQYISYEDEKYKWIFQRLSEQYHKSECENTWLIMDITDETVWEFGYYADSVGFSGINLELDQSLKDALQTKACRVRVQERVYYVEPLIQAGTVYIFGAGHVAKELVPVLSHLAFRCVVLDDREELLKKDNFPTAIKRLLCDFNEINKVVEIKAHDYVVIMTRGHVHDFVLQSQALAMRPKYIGVIGSRNKIAIVTNKLLEQGYTKQEIEQCHMPIGFDIQAETPAEIAISIAAELINIRKG